MVAIEDALYGLGFNKKEVAIYLSGISLGEAPVSSIARNAKINRVTTYGILKQFCDRGFASEVRKGTIKYYVLITPASLLSMRRTKVQNLEGIMPDLLGYMNDVVSKPKILFYQGIDALKKLFLDIIITPEPFRVFLGTTDMDPHFNHFLETDFLPYRKKIKTPTRAIVSKSVSKYADYNRKAHESIIIDDPLFDIANEIIVYDYDKIALCSFSTKEISAVIIHSKEFHNCMGSLFELVRKIYKNK